MTPFAKLVGFLVKEKVMTEEQIANVLGPNWNQQDVREIFDPPKAEQDPSDQVVS